ncbi:MAG: FtsW/RodA/SpoVE family cell cycle protein [Anaerolineae bacterium]|nr:FtsW/RodA/SpoVE family cell cycle protein [Anaerolineae bacterium]
MTFSSLTRVSALRETTPEALIRRRELLLLLLAAAFLAVILTGLIVARGLSPSNYWHLAVWAGCAVGGHLALNRRVPRRDPFLFPTVMLLSGWGIVLTQRLTTGFAERQTVWLILATAALVGVAYLPGHLRWLSRYRYTWLGFGLALLAVTIVLGRNPGSEFGPRLWLGVADFNFQPSELLKVILVVFMASYLADNHDLIDLNPHRLGPLRLPSLRYLGPLILMWGISVVVLLWQRDLGAATLFFVVFVILLYLGSGRAIYLLGGAALLVLAGGIAYLTFGVVERRVDVWLNPWPQASGAAFQVVQSLMAVASGGVAGQGIGQGSPTYVPVVHSDFMFAAVAEEFGLIGALAVTALIALIVLRGLRLAAQTQARAFRAFLAAGLSVMLGVQSLMIMGGVLKLIPLTGVTLPFLSYGGSSLLMSFVMVGLLIVLSGER